MQNIKLALIAAVLLLTGTSAKYVQQETTWHGKQCAVVLTYDDAIDVDLDNVVPALDSMQFKGTFYLIGSSPVISKRLNEWKRAALEGHELGNHSMNPQSCPSMSGRSLVKATRAVYEDLLQYLPL